MRQDDASGIFNAVAGLAVVVGAIIIGIMAICTGCGTNAAQRDAILWLLQGERDGQDGANCWDGRDDWNGPEGVPDGVLDSFDCQGVAGADGRNGQDGSEGPGGQPGPAGPTGPAGADGNDGVTTIIVITAESCTTLCHDGHTVTVAAPAVAEHLAHGDTCGECE